MRGLPPGGLVGRAAELTALDAFLDASEKGFVALTIEGEPGIGKTALLAECIRRARTREVKVLLARATESEAGLSHGGLSDLFDRVPETTLEQLPRPQGETLRAALLRSPVGDRGIDERALYAGVLSTLRILASTGPIVIAIDDAQWLDPSTTRALRFAARRLESERIGILVTLRVWERSIATFLDAADAKRSRTLRLGRLSAASLHKVIKNHTGVSLSRPVTIQVARSCGGNPLYALEVVGTLSERTRAAPFSPPPSLGELLSARLGRLPAVTRHALALAAAISHPTTALVDLEALAPALADGIISLEHERIEFAHPLFASAVYGSLDAAGRRAVHGSLAHRLADIEESARHAALAAEGADGATAARLDAAATNAERRGAPAAAAELVELALASTPSADGVERLGRMVTAARHWLAAGDLDRTQQLLDVTLRDSPPPALRARALQLLAQLRGRRSSFAEAAVAASEALSFGGDDPELLSAIELDIAFCSASLGDLAGTEQHARAALGWATASQQSGAVAEALGAVTMAVFLRGGGLDEQALSTAVRLEDRGRRSPMQMRPSYLRGHLALWTGRLDEALRILETIHDEALERGEEGPLPLLNFYLVWGWIWEGNLERAAELAVEAATLAPLLGDHAATGCALLCSALVHAHSGAVDAARRDARESIGHFEQLRWPIFVPWALWSLGLAETSVGDPRAVDTLLGPAAARLLAMGPIDPALGVFVPDEIEALVELGEHDRAESLIAWLAERDATLDRAWAAAAASRCRALLAAARGDLASAFAALDEALAQHRRAKMPFEQARTLLVLGRLQRRTRQRSLAGTTLREALALFERCGAQQWAARASAELRPLHVHTAHPDQLTPTEERVAGLAARGLPNRAIAQQAMLSLKAVEANLTRVYRKLGVSSRAALADALRTTQPDPRS